jgi:hypothetical protein
MIALNKNVMKKNTETDVLQLVGCFKRDWVRYADLNRMLRLVLGEFDLDAQSGPSQIKALLQSLASQGKVQYKKVGSAAYYKAVKE